MNFNYFLGGCVEQQKKNAALISLSLIRTFRHEEIVNHSSYINLFLYINKFPYINFVMQLLYS